ncbi:MAG: hypothetical protein LQ346_004011 [Caloplaca aetnensis]|nr:MAG: hypothetical protein LQ346_004011 [Caloplaca aetnensis]
MALDTSYRRPVIIPEAPSPKANVKEVQTFLVRYFISLGYGDDEAEQNARKLLNHNGHMIYAKEERVLKEHYGDAGEELYSFLQHSEHGRVSAWITRFADYGTFGFAGYKGRIGTAGTIIGVGIELTWEVAI